MSLTFTDVKDIFVYELKSFKKSLFICFLTLSLLLLHSASFANSVPAVDSITPPIGQSAPDTAVTFTAIYRDADGWQNIKETYLLISTSLNAQNCCYLYYNQNTNKLYMRNDAGSSWLGGYYPGSPYIIENSYAKLDCSKVKVAGSTTTKRILWFKVKIPGPVMTIKWDVTFKSAFAGKEPKKLYLYVRDDSNRSCGWAERGRWTIEEPPIPVIVPTVTIVEPINNVIMNAEP